MLRYPLWLILSRPSQWRLWSRASASERIEKTVARNMLCNSGDMGLTLCCSGVADGITLVRTTEARSQRSWRQSGRSCPCGVRAWCDTFEFRLSLLVD